MGRVVLGGHRVLALVRPSGQLLALHALHFPEQLRSQAALPPPPLPETVSPEEQHLAGMLIDAACQPIACHDYRDDTAQQVRTLIEAKLAGQTATVPAPEEVTILPLVDALKRSVVQALKDTGASATGESSPKKPRKTPGKAPAKAAGRRSA